MKWKALILSGGGSTGEFQIGALKVISKEYKKFDFYAGVGVGSLNSSVLAQYDSLSEGYNVLLEVWDNIKRTSDIFDIPLLGSSIGALTAVITEEGWARDGIYGNKKVNALIDKCVDWNLLKSKDNWGILTTSLSDGQIYTITNNKELLIADTNYKRLLKLSLNPTDLYYIGSKFNEFLSAAGSVPLMLPPVDIFGHRFAEGGIRDFTPLQLAVKAYALAKSKGYTEAEFIILNNYTVEVSFEDPTLLDSGVEAFLRGIKIMSVEMAKNDIEQGRLELDSINEANYKIIQVAPIVDYRLKPMDFNDLKLRSKMRNHGTTRAIEVLNPDFDEEETKQLYNNLDQVDDSDIDKLIWLQITHPTESQIIRENISPISAERITLVNVNKEIEIISPKNLHELIEIMQDAKDSRKRIRPVGAGYAFSQILEFGTNDGIHISLSENLNAISIELNTILKDPSKLDELIEFEAGATIEQLTTRLWDMGKALINQPGYEKLSFLGVASTGGHGSGMEIGPVADSICSIYILTFDNNGKLVRKRIERTNGITDPDKFKNEYPEVELIQNDIYFNACRVSAGCMGVIFSIIIKTQPSFYLQETRTLTLWNNLKKTLPAKLKDKGIHSIHVWFNPYKIDDEIFCVLSEYRVCEGPRMGKRGFGTTFNGVDELAPLLLWVMNTFPRKLPHILNETLKLVVNEQPVVMPCFEALNFGSPNFVKVDAANNGVPTEEVVKVADGLFELIESRFQTGAYVTCPIGFRFTSASDALFTPQYGRETCMIELPLVYGTSRATDTIKAFHEFLINNYNGRPHWGQRIDKIVTKEVIKIMYKDTWKSFVEVYKNMNDGTFDGKFTEDTGLRELADEI